MTWSSRNLFGRGSTFEKDHVAPLAVTLTNAFSDAHCAKPCLAVYGQTCVVLRKDARLDGPYPIRCCGVDQTPQQRRPNGPSPAARGDVDAVFDHALVRTTTGHRRRGNPPNDTPIRIETNEPMFRQMPAIELSPPGSRRLEGGIPRIHPRLVDLQNQLSVISEHRHDSLHVPWHALPFIGH